MNGMTYWNGGQVFHNEQFGEIRSLTINNAPWWVGKDVAAALGYTDTSQALRAHVDNEDKLTRDFNGSGQNRKMTVINESGLYSLILSSKLPSAKAFKRWVTSEVLPAIRQYGIAKAVSEERRRAPLSERLSAPVGPIPTTANYPPPPLKKPEISIGEALKAVELVVKCKPDRLPYVLEILRRGGFDLPERGS